MHSDTSSKATNSAPEGSFQQTLERGVGNAAAAAHESIDSVSQAARPALDSATAGAHSAVDRAGEAATRAASSVGDKGDRLNASREKLTAQAGGFVRANPLASLGLAIAAGYFLSRALSARSGA